MTANPFFESLLVDQQVQKLVQKLVNTHQKQQVFPELKNTFRAFELTNLDKVKVVIFGQDPYYQPGVADGLAFSSLQANTPASLKNIFLALKSQYPNIILETNDLSTWAKQGVLLLNTALSVVAYQPNSHSDFGWFYVIEKAINYINQLNHQVVFCLWGKQAQKLKNLISTKHKVLTSSHPSPLSAHYGFLTSNHFLLINQFLVQNQVEPIDWNLQKK